MSYQVAVCDDNKNEAQYVAGFVKKWAKMNYAAVHIDIFPSSEAFLFHYAENKNYDILILDIEMGAIDGVTLAKMLRRENETLEIIFVTGYSDYISEGYEVAALHYLLKPVREEKLLSVLDRAAYKLRQNEKVLTFEMSGEMVRIPIYQIRYAQVQRNYTTIYANDSVTLKMPLGKLKELLDERFCQAGRSLLVNMTCIRRVTKTEIILQDGTLLLLPRGAYETVNRAIINMR